MPANKRQVGPVLLIFSLEICLTLLQSVTYWKWKTMHFYWLRYENCIIMLKKAFTVIVLQMGRDFGRWAISGWFWTNMEQESSSWWNFRAIGQKWERSQIYILSNRACLQTGCSSSEKWTTCSPLYSSVRFPQMTSPGKNCLGEIWQNHKWR